MEGSIKSKAQLLFVVDINTKIPPRPPDF